MASHIELFTDEFHIKPHKVWQQLLNIEKVKSYERLKSARALSVIDDSQPIPRDSNDKSLAAVLGDKQKKLLRNFLLINVIQYGDDDIKWKQRIPCGKEHLTEVINSVVRVTNLGSITRSCRSEDQADLRLHHDDR